MCLILWLCGEVHIQVIQGYQNCLLTPNIAEFGRLAAAVGVELPGKIGVQWQLKVGQTAEP
jgi:ATP-dependent NAD(P)H-hydrate dehydratase